MDALLDDMTSPHDSPQIDSPQIDGESKIFFAEVLYGERGSPSRCRSCTCMLDPELRGDEHANKNANSESVCLTADQNPTTWPRIQSLFWEDRNNNAEEMGVGLHTDAKNAACHLLDQKHKASFSCIGLQHGKPHEKQRYELESSNQVFRDKCNQVLRRIWCEQQAHGLTNLCYFISETAKLCFDALGVPCQQFYGWMDRGRNSFTHAWVNLGEKKQLIDITFYLEKSGKMTNGYWCDLKDYQIGLGPSTMKDETEFKKNHHWKYVYLCTLVAPRRDFLRCLLKYMIDDLRVQIPDVFKDAVSSCWNCGAHLGSSSIVTCPECESAVFCSANCQKEERSSSATHLEICADYHKRQKNNSLLLRKPAVKSIDELLRGS